MLCIRYSSVTKTVRVIFSCLQLQLLLPLLIFRISAYTLWMIFSPTSFFIRCLFFFLRVSVYRSERQSVYYDKWFVLIVYTPRIVNHKISYFELWKITKSAFCVFPFKIENDIAIGYVEYYEFIAVLKSTLEGSVQITFLVLLCEAKSMQSIGMLYQKYMYKVYALWTETGVKQKLTMCNVNIVKLYFTVFSAKPNQYNRS